MICIVPGMWRSLCKCWFPQFYQARNWTQKIGIIYVWAKIDILKVRGKNSTISDHLATENWAQASFPNSMFSWYLEISHGGNIDAIEIGKQYQGFLLPPLPLESCFLPTVRWEYWIQWIYQHTNESSPSGWEDVWSQLYNRKGQI